MRSLARSAVPPFGMGAAKIRTVNIIGHPRRMMKAMMNEATKPIKPGSEQDDPEYPYLLFVQDKG